MTLKEPKVMFVWCSEIQMKKAVLMFHTNQNSWNGWNIWAQHWNFIDFYLWNQTRSTYNVNEYNSVGPALKTILLNHFKDQLKACEVADSLNRELISCLTFHSNKHARGRLDHVNWTFVGYKWTKYSVWDVLIPWYSVENIFDIFIHRQFQSLWYPQTHCMISCACKIWN